MPDLQAFRDLASELDRIDVDVYEAYGKDPLEPIIGMGDRRCRLAIMGRDPGRHEVEFGEPFIGAGGQIVRRGLFDAMHPASDSGFSFAPVYTFEASREVGRHVFWANTVPYKPIGNKAWGMRCKRRFHPHMADILIHDWDGTDLLALGRDAVMWFGLTNKAIKTDLAAFWEQEDRYEQTVDVPLTATDGTTRMITVHPVPHPSPLNARWYRQVPELLTQRLNSLEWGTETWQMPE